MRPWEGAVLTRADIEAAHARIRAYVRRTPVVTLEPAALGLPCRVTLKLESLQHTGSFKPRGAFNRVLSSRVPATGIIAASGGNHGAAVAYVARQLGFPAEIFVPEIASAPKVERIRAYGAKLVITGLTYADALEASLERAEKTGALMVHAYDQPEVLAGQGTIGLELEAQAPDLDALLVSVGGGGLIGGIAAWYAGRVRVVGVESEACPTFARALEAGKPVDVDVGGIAADSLGARRVGSHMFEVAQRFRLRSVLVTDAAIREAQRALWRHLRIVAEPGGAAGVAALLSGAYAPGEEEHVGVLISGANTELGSIEG
ncbi:MAG: threonine/serine dehydratase [Euryarchaeota archaeon]|nr:threonine/serine dehydratase [Euryarchaeota archaeon]